VRSAGYNICLRSGFALPTAVAASKEIIMKRSLLASMRRVNRLMGPAKMTRATRSFQSAMGGLMVDTAMAPLAALGPPPPTKRRKAPVPKVGRTLGAVLKQMRAAQSLMPGAMGGSTGRGVAPVVPVGAQYLSRKHRSATGSRNYQLYLPARQPTQPKGLILMLHGCNQTPDDFAVGTHMNALAEKNGFAVAWPAQTGRHNAASCWNWFKPGNQRRGAGEPALLAALARKLAKEFGLGRDATFVAGLSAGGAMAAILADVYPDVFSAAGVHSGLARGAARDVMSAMSAMRSGGDTGPAAAVATSAHTVRRIVFHGDNDRTVHPSNAALIVAAAMGGAAVPKRTGQSTVRGRGYARSVFAPTDSVGQLELWMLDGAGHAWSGGRAAGSYTDTKGPDASAQMIRFFLGKSA